MHVLLAALSSIAIITVVLAACWLLMKYLESDI